MSTHDNQILDFTYYGMVRSHEGDPHGPGIAICNLNRQHCYMGTWECGQLIGLGQRFIESTVGRSVHYGKFVGIR